MNRSLSVLLAGALSFSSWVPMQSVAGEFKFKIVNPEPEADGRFGMAITAVGSSGNMLVAAPASFVAGGSTGAAYVMDGRSGDLLQTFRSPSANPGQFGRSVAALSDNDILIGGVEFSATILGPPLGHFYHFDAATGSLLNTFDPPRNEDTSYGQRLAAEANGILVGASESSIAGPSFSGAAYLLDVRTGKQLQRFLPPSPTMSGLFGDTIAMAGDHVVLGSGGVETDAAHVFSTTTGDVLQTLRSPEPGDGDLFGFRVAAEDNNVLVSAVLDDAAGHDAGAAYLFDASTGDLTQTFLNPTPEKNDFFGVSLAIRGDRVLIAANGDDSLQLDNGAAYLFDANSGDLLDTFLRPTATTIPEKRYAGFGFDVGFLDDHHVFVADPFDNTGAERAGAVYVYETKATPVLVGDCNGDDVLGVSDLSCVSSIEARDLVLAALNTLPGDLDGNGEVGFADFITLSQNYGKDSPRYVDGNIDLRGGVTFEDFIMLANGFGKTPKDLTAVPEPTGIAMIWLGVLCGTVARRRR